MALPSAFLDELRARLRVSEVVGRQVRLVRKGRDLWGLCPFHKEKTPSFKVDEERGFYHCFGCGAHGSAIDFVMNSENLAFREAVERLAGEAGMELPRDTPEEREKARRRASLAEVVEAACAFFERQLRMPEGRAGLDYLRSRGLDDDTIAAFRLGFAPESRQALRTHLSREGVPEEDMAAAGLVIVPEDPARGPYDRFRGRVIFPITDRQGRVVAFGGRVLGASDGPKYLNSPETPLFSKGRMLYGLAQARAAARTAGTVIVTEGYMDVIALARAGFANAVAPLGTALTEDQIDELWRLVPEPVVCFDGDAAGQRAASRAAERALPGLKPGFGLKFVALPAGEDPDSLVATRGAQAFRQILEAAVPLSDMLWRLEVDGRTLKTPEERARVETALKRRAWAIEDEGLRRHYLSAFREKLWEAVRATRSAGPARTGRRAFAADEMRPTGAERLPRANAAPGVDSRHRQEQILLATLVGHPQIFDSVEEALGSVSFSTPHLDNLRREVLKTLGGESSLDSATLQNHLKRCGHSRSVDEVMHGDVLGHAYFARPQASPEVALRGWQQAFSHYRGRDLDADIADAQRRLEREMSQESFDCLQALLEEKRRLSGGDGDGAT